MLIHDWKLNVCAHKSKKKKLAVYKSISSIITYFVFAQCSKEKCNKRIRLVNLTLSEVSKHKVEEAAAPIYVLKTSQQEEWTVN